MKKILISVVMPTYNSEKTIALALQSVRDQTFLQDQIEILVIDGGSTDTTRQIANKFNCTILDNPKVQPEFAKHIGINNARGKYCVFLDSDEQLLNKKSFQIKYDLLESNSGVKNVLIGGLKNPKGYPFINEYASRFGDPFSYFMYGVDADDYIKSLKHRFKSKIETKEYIIYNVTNEITPICDGGGHFFDLDFLKKITDIKEEKIISLVFDTMVAKTHAFTVIRNDYVYHYSNTNIRSYLHKLNWRIVNNIHYKETVATGFSSREEIGGKILSFKKYSFILYLFTVFLPIIESFFLAIKLKRFEFLYIHTLSSFFIGIQIIYNYLLLIFRITPKLRNYK